MKKTAPKKAARRKPPVAGKVAPTGNTRNLRLVSGITEEFSDWPILAQTPDSDWWQNQFIIRQRMRDLFETNPFFVSYQWQLVGNVFGDQGMKLRMRIKETEDRIVYSEDPEMDAEKWLLIAHERKMQKVVEWARRRTDRRDIPDYRIFERDDRGNVTVQVGMPDLYADKQFEDGWAEWKKAEYCDVRGQREYNELCHLRLISGVRDGDIFIRTISDPKVNDFGFTLQMVNAEYCDYWLNTTLPNGNVIRMGIEYQWRPYGLGKPVAYYFIKRQPMDWQWSQPGINMVPSTDMYDRIPAEQIIHYARFTNNDSTRPSPWCANAIPKGWMLERYEQSEVTAARAAACKMGWFTSTLVPEGGAAAGQFPVDAIPDPRKVRGMGFTPGSMTGLPWGVEAQTFDPSHPNGNYEQFRKGMLRSITAGMPGSSYSGTAQDYAEINFSAGRLERLNYTDTWKMIQQFDIRKAEDPIFNEWAQMALLKGAIPLPLAKWKSKYKGRCVFQARGWKGVDDVKESTAAAMDIANKLTSRTRECAERGEDFDEILLELADEEMKLEAYGMSTATTAEVPSAPPKTNEELDTEDDPEKPDDSTNPPVNGKKPAKKNGRHVTLRA